MKKMTTILVTLLSIAMLPYVSYGADQSDHALAAGSEVIYCGVDTKKAEPWTLHVSAASDGGDTLRIEFNDGASIDFGIPGGQSFSTTQVFGGVPGVDDLVRITMVGGEGFPSKDKFLASAKVRSGAKDPFADDGEKDNFCVTCNGDPGCGSPPITTFPNNP